MDSKITMLRNDNGKLIIDRKEIDNEVHRHFKEKFQSKQKTLDEMDYVTPEEQTPIISERCKNIINKQPTTTETKLQLKS